MLDDMIDAASKIKPAGTFALLLDLARAEKKRWITVNERGDIPPTLLIERDGVILAKIVAPQVDKTLAFTAANICRHGCQMDAVTVFLDAHAATADSNETTAEEFAKKWPPGSMQRMCDEEGACERGEITDVIVCQNIEEKKVCFAAIPYRYHGKNGGVPFAWAKEEELMFMDERVKGMRIEGRISDTFRNIMDAQPFFQRGNMPQFMLSMRNKDPFKAWYHTSRAALRSLATQDYIVLDCAGFQLPFEKFEEHYAATKKLGKNAVIQELTRMLNDGP